MSCSKIIRVWMLLTIIGIPFLLLSSCSTQEKYRPQEPDVYVLQDMPYGQFGEDINNLVNRFKSRNDRNYKEIRRLR